MTEVPQIGSRFPATRDALHQVAFFALSPARYAATGRMGLTPTEGGFGTPDYGGSVARVQGDRIIVESDAGSAMQAISTVRAAARFVGIEYRPVWFDDFRDPLHPVDPDQDLPVDEPSSDALGQWFAFGEAVLQSALERVPAVDSPSTIQLWPEHFDLAFEAGEESGGMRASFGASPGDAAHPEPYLYVAAWGEIDRANPYWNDGAFNGASLGHGDLIGAADPHERAVAFLMEGRRVLGADRE